MRIMFCTRPAYGHVYPLMPLAEAARDANHDVVFATCGEFVPKLERLGFPVESVGISIEQGRDEFVAAGATLAGDGGRTDMKAGAELFVSIVGRRTAAELLPVLRRVEPDLVVYEQYEFGAPVAAGVVGIPAVAHALSPQLPAAVRELDRGPAGTASVG